MSVREHSSGQRTRPITVVWPIKDDGFYPLWLVPGDWTRGKARRRCAMSPERPVEVQDEWEGYDDGLDSGPCSHCGGEGFCSDGADPLGDCPDDLHRCHACGGSGNRSDQVIF